MSIILFIIFHLFINLSIFHLVGYFLRVFEYHEFTAKDELVRDPCRLFFVCLREELRRKMRGTKCVSFSEGGAGVGRESGPLSGMGSGGERKGAG